MSKEKYNPVLRDAVEYCELVDILEDKKPLTLMNPIYDKNPKRFYLVEKDNDVLLVSIEKDRLVFCFQGSNDKKDWINNFKAGKCDEWALNGGRVHHGWWDSMLKFKDEIISLCSEHGNSKKIEFKGHSRGGSLSILASFLVATKLNFPVSVITFGAPMVGNTSFRDEFRLLPINLTECQFSRDIVCDIPPKLLGYKNVGYIKRLKPRAKHFIPVVGRIISHLDYYDAIRERT